MDEQEYLEQIAKASKRPTESSKLKRILSSKFFMVGAVGLGLLVIILIIGAILNGGEKEITRVYGLKLHVEGTASVISDYQPSVKSSTLRSSSASLSGVLANTSKELTDYLVGRLSEDDSKTSNNLTEEASLEKDALANELFEAKINGILDRIYAHKMAYEISVITTEEANIINSTSNTELQNILLTSYNSLKNLYDKFSNFSETK